MTQEDMLKMGYVMAREVPGRGWCGLQRYIYTFGLCYNVDEVGLSGRWCYENFADAVLALHAWNGVGDPPGDWIKYKGRGGERCNPEMFKGIPISNES